MKCTQMSGPPQKTSIPCHPLPLYHHPIYIQARGDGGLCNSHAPRVLLHPLIWHFMPSTLLDLISSSPPLPGSCIVTSFCSAVLLSSPSPPSAASFPSTPREQKNTPISRLFSLRCPARCPACRSGEGTAPPLQHLRCFTVPQGAAQPGFPPLRTL